MKRILLILAALVLCFCLIACDEDTAKDDGNLPENEKVEDNIGGKTPEKEEEEVKKPEVFYTGMVYQLPSNGTAKFNALKTDGTFDSLGDRGVYGYPEITEDGKYIFYRQTQPNAETREYTQRLFVMKPGESAFELAENAKAFVLSKDEKCIAANCGNSVYFTDDFSKRCEKIFETTESVTSLILSETSTKIACVDYVGNLYMIDIASKTSTPIDTGVTYVIKRVCDNTLYYAKDDGLYLWSNGASTFVSNWWLSTDFDQIFATGTERERQYHYITSNGTVYDIDPDVKVSSFSMMSSNEKYFVTGSGATLYRYEITDSGFINKTELKGEDMTIYRINNDGIVVACSADDKSFGIFETSEYKKLSDGMLLINRMGYSSCVHFADGCVYFSADNNLYKYTFGGETELVAENMYSFAADGNWCYYTNNYDKSKEYGDLWSVGGDAMIDDYVKYIYVR